MKKFITTLLVIRKNGRVLLARKLRGFGAGKLNGVGGKLEPGESVTHAMIRETQEEIGVTPTKFEKLGLIEYNEVMKGERSLVCMHLFVATEFEGEPKGSDEMSEPVWLDENNLPWNDMIGDDKYWYPYFLANKKFKAKFHFDDEFNLLSHEVFEVDKFEEE